MPNHSLIGSWKLIDFFMGKTNGDTKQLFGENPKGYIFYLENGYFAVCLMSKDRTPFKHKKSTEEEKTKAFDEFFSYFGTYEFENGKVHHHIDCCSRPDWIGLTKTRSVNFENKRILLSTEPFDWEGETVTGKVLFEKLL